MTPKHSEDELGEKYDRSITYGLTRTAGGLAAGLVLSFVAFQRKVWPIAFSTGVGLGMGMSNCQHEFQSILPVTLACKRVTAEPTTSQTEVTTNSEG